MSASLSAVRPVAAPAATPKIVVPPRDAAPTPRDWATVSPSHLKRGQKNLLLSFALAVLLPLAIAAWYLYGKAQDQFASTVGFSVQHESMENALSLATGLQSITGSSSPDTDIIYSYIYSQSLVADIDAALDLRAMWNKAEGDVIFRFGDDRTIEDLVDYWHRMVEVEYDSATRLIEVRVKAFDPQDARQIATMIFDRSSMMINQLNEAALRDAVSFTSEDLEKTQDELRAARQAMTAFRNEHQLVDPVTDAAAQMTLVSMLEQNAAQARIELDLLRQTASPTDPRIPPMENRLQVIEAQIKAERAKFGIGTGSGDGVVMANTVAEYESLKVDQEFAETAYQSARAAHELALSDARRQSRYLAAHMMPTMAEGSRDPRRVVILATIGLGLVLLWSIAVLMYYSLRDRR